MYRLIKPDQPLDPKAPAPRVYLGGQCRGRDWRLEFFQRFERANVSFVNPKRESFKDPELDPAGHVEQVSWERSALEWCDLGVFWLGDGLPNQAARVEIGYLLGNKRPVLLGADQTFMGSEHLAAFSGLVLTTSIEGLMNRFASILASFQTS